MRLLAFLVFVFIAAASAARADDAVATYIFTKGWATFGLALPQGAARDAVQVGKLPTQTDVKVRWPDGSIRFAVVSANIPAASTLPICRRRARAGSMTAAATPVVTVTLTIGGRPYVAQPARRAH